MYVTGLCGGQPSFDSGKFHNHCTDCPDFGTCIGDYREAHCMDCGKHWFSGMSGFPCSHCGGGHGGGRKSKPLAELPPPPLSAFDGTLPGAVEKIRERLPSMPPLQRMMIQSLLSGAGYSDPPPDAADDSSGRPGSRTGATHSTGGRLPADEGPTDGMVGMLAAMLGGGAGEGLPSLPAALREQLAQNPEAMMAVLSMMMEGGGSGGAMPSGSDDDGESMDDDKDDDEPRTGSVGRAKSKVSRRAAESVAGKKLRRGGGSGGRGGGRGHGGGGVSQCGGTSDGTSGGTSGGTSSASYAY